MQHSGQWPDYDPTEDEYRDNRLTDEGTALVQDAIGAACIGLALLVMLVYCAGCQSISVTADNGALVSIEGSNSKPISAGVDADMGDAALAAAATLAGAGAGGMVAGLPGAAVGAGAGYMLNAAADAITDDPVADAAAVAEP